MSGTAGRVVEGEDPTQGLTWPAPHGTDAVAVPWAALLIFYV
jgi:hypothetical protein